MGFVAAKLQKRGGLSEGFAERGISEHFDLCNSRYDSVVMHYVYVYLMRWKRIDAVSQPCISTQFPIGPSLERIVDKKDMRKILAQNWI